MDYKEKLKDIINSNKTPFVDIDTFLKYFPELQESEDERIRKELIEFVKSRGRFKREYIAWLEKKCEQKPAWSEEDERNLDWLITVCERIYYKSDPQVSSEGALILRDWLKSIKDRVQLQPKQEWKQENTDDLTDFENAMMHIGDSFFGNNAGLDPNDTNAIKEQANLLLELVPSREWSEEDEGFCIEAIKLLTNPSLYEICTNLRTEVGDWLKSLRPQSTWKPSDEQIIELRRVISGCSYDIEPLAEMEEELKKLREEKL